MSWGSARTVGLSASYADRWARLVSGTRRSMEAAAAPALSSAIAFGGCDFIAGIASRRISFWWVALVSLLASVAGAWVLVLVAQPVATQLAVLWGAVAGLGAAIGSSALYRGYGRGKMAVAGPVSAVGAAALP